MKTRYQPCPKCCEITCVEPTIHWKSRSASKTKCGFSEFTGFVSTPPKIYRKKTVSGSGFQKRYDSFLDEWVIDFTWVYDGEAVYDGDCLCSSSMRVLYSDTSETPLACGFTTSGIYTTTVSGTVMTYFRQDEAEPGNVIFQDDLTITLSDEYLTATLKTDTVAALPVGYPNATPGSYFNLTSDELTNAIREGVVWFTFPAPIKRARPNPCYHITWVERFTPTTGSPVDTPKTWTWDGEIPEGYDPEDGETWPSSPDFTVPIPTTNGTTTVEDVVVSCTDCE